MLESLFDKVAGLNACNFIKKRHQHRYFANNDSKFLRTFFFIDHLRWLLVSTSRNIVGVTDICIDSSRHRDSSIYGQTPIVELFSKTGGKASCTT